MKKIIYFFIITMLVGVMLISIVSFHKDYSEDRKQEEVYEKLISITKQTKGDTQSDTEENITNNNNNETAKEVNYTELFNKNSDMVAWIKIEDTNINYPVMQTKDRPNYYLNRNFYKEYSAWGTPYIQENCDFNYSDNVIIYAHHIKNYQMFGELERYKSKQFYEEHRIIEFVTKEKSSKYEVIAVFKTDANTGFKYYDFVKSQNEGEFNTFIKKCKELSFYNIKNTAEYGDKLITLSTCEYSSKNGRLVVIAKELS